MQWCRFELADTAYRIQHVTAALKSAATGHHGRSMHGQILSTQRSAIAPSVYFTLELSTRGPVQEFPFLTVCESYNALHR